MKKYLITTCVSILSMSIAFAQVSVGIYDNDDAVSTCISIPVKIQYQSKDNQVTNYVTLLQDFLHENNYLASMPTGFFGAGTVKAVKAFQRANGILETGALGPNTRAKLKVLSCGELQNKVTSNPSSLVSTSPAVTVPHNSTQSLSPVTCSGSHPVAADGVILNEYTSVSFGVSGGSNSVWQYGSGSCTWSCQSPKIKNDAGTGCKNPIAGSGLRVSITKSDNGQLSAVTVNPIDVRAGNQITKLSSLNTNANGEVGEFWFQDVYSVGAYKIINLDGAGMLNYKIKSATGCTPFVFINNGKQVNNCKDVISSGLVTINLIPGDIATLPKIVYSSSEYKVGQNIEGVVVGGDPADTWSCLDIPNQNNCKSAGTMHWRQLTKDYDGHVDGWHLVSDHNGDKITLSPMKVTSDFPEGVYTTHVKTGQYTGSSIQTTFTIKK